jgi:RNA polymerase nonessential primary-like sigma factor
MNQSRTVRLPVHIVRELNKYKRVSYQMAQTLQHQPSIQEIADSTENSIDRISQLMNLNRTSASVDALIGDGSDTSYTTLDSVEDTHSENSAAIVQEHEVLDHIDEWLGFLADKPREIIERRFGLSCYGLERGEPQTVEQVAREVGVTRERVRQIQIQALSKFIRNGYTWHDVSRLENH